MTEPTYESEIPTRTFESDGGYEASRRTVLRGAGAGAVTLAGLPAVTAGARADEDDESAGKVVFIYDDSPREDYTKTFPVHEEFGVPGCVAACPGLMGTADAWMHPGHLEEMHEAGWEVMSHTSQHRALGEIPLRGDVDSGDTELHVQSNLHGRFEGDPLVVFDDQNEATATVAGTDQDGDDQLLVLEEPLGESFEAGDGYRTWVRYTDEFTEQILEESKAQLEEWGFPVTGYVHTYNRYDGYVTEVLPEYYEATPNRRRGGLNPTFEPDPFELSRTNFEDDKLTDDELADLLDTVANEPDFGILYAHSNAEAFTEDRIETAIEMALERDIEIVTLQEALADYEVLEAPETPSDSGNASESSGNASESSGNASEPSDDSTPSGGSPEETGGGSSGGSLIDWIRERIRTILRTVFP